MQAKAEKSWTWTESPTNRMRRPAKCRWIAAASNAGSAQCAGLYRREPMAAPREAESYAQLSHGRRKGQAGCEACGSAWPADHVPFSTSVKCSRRL